MRIKSILENISEKFLKGVKYGTWNDKYGEIFKNPRLSELRSVNDEEDNEYNEVRFLAVKDKRDFYIWNPNILHKDVSKHLGYSMKEMKLEHFASFGYIRNDKIEVKINYMYEVPKSRYKELSNEILSGEYDYLSKYYVDMVYLKKDAENYV